MLHHAGRSGWETTATDYGSFPISSRVFSETQQSKFHAVLYIFPLLLFSLKEKGLPVTTKT
jgi:hypothetical protein